MPARWVCSISVRLRSSTTTDSTPARASRWDSIRPAGPPPTMPTGVRITSRGLAADMSGSMPSPGSGCSPPCSVQWKLVQRGRLVDEGPADAARGDLHGGHQADPVVLQAGYDDPERGDHVPPGADRDTDRAGAEAHLL